MPAGIGAGPLYHENAALRTNGDRAGAVTVRQVNGEFIVFIELVDVIGLLLREQQAAIEAHDAIGVLVALPNQSPLRPRLNHAGNCRDRHVFWRRRLREVSWLRDKLAEGEKGCEQKPGCGGHAVVIPQSGNPVAV